ncbi:hypothetical protein BgiMline_021803 [Biomphalaria glabrata]|nr:hypothetical protein BgiMline_028374 [Biomphalaria glabrata]
MCADNIMGSFSGHDDENLCWVKVDSCAEQGKLLVGSNCTEGIFSTLTNQNADKLICLYSQSEADIERLNVLYNTDQLIYLSSLSLYYMNENKEELIIKVFKKEKLSLDANKVLVYQLKRLNKCKPSCELPSELNGLWYGNRHSIVSIKNDVFIANRIVEEDCNSTEPCSNLDKSRAMRCIYQSDYNFLLRTEHTVVDLVPYAIYSCFYFSHISPNKLVFIFNQRDIDPLLKVYAKLMFAKPIIKSAEALCMVNGAYLPVHVNVLIRQGSQHKISEACPKVILKGYKYQMGSCKFVLKFRADDNLFEVVTDCTGGKDDLPFFSVTKKVICVHSSGESKDNGTNFVFLYNDNVPRGPYTYRFVCILYSIQEDTINMTAIPFLCSDTETEFKMQTIFGKAIGDTELEDVLKELGSAEELTTTVSITYLVITALVLNSCLAMYMYRKGRKAEPDEDTSDDEDGEDDDYNMRDSVMISSTDLNG